ncbi:MAG: aquaporin Z [Bacteroidales bacterium]|nr:aquaporin Z [Bacteroidales bacterium]
MSKLTKQLIAECIGTFTLVAGGCGTAIFAGGSVGFLGVSIAFGLTVVAMAYGLGHISGAHLNPAVSFGCYVNGRMSAKDMFAYWAAQIVGAIVAAGVLAIVAKESGMDLGTFAANGFGNEFYQGAAGYQDCSMAGAFITECVLTFLFLMVILGATDKKGAGINAGLAIGLTLVLIHLISIPLTNTSVNPARSISQALFSENGLALKQLWLFIVAPLAGAGLAGLCYKTFQKEDKE